MANNQNFKIKNGLDVGTDIYVNSNLHVGGTVVFEGATVDTFQTTLSATDPTQDNTIVVPNAGGTLAVSVSDTTTSTQGDLNLDFSLSATGAVSATGDAHGLATTDSPTFAGLTINGNTIVLEGTTANDFETQLNVVDPTADNLINIPNNSGTFVVDSSNTTTTTQGDLNTTVSISATGVVSVSGDAHGLATTDSPTFNGLTLSSQLTWTDGTTISRITAPDSATANGGQLVLQGGSGLFNGGGIGILAGSGGAQADGGADITIEAGESVATNARGGDVNIRAGKTADSGAGGYVNIIGGENTSAGVLIDDAIRFSVWDPAGSFLSKVVTIENTGRLRANKGMEIPYTAFNNVAISFLSSSATNATLIKFVDPTQNNTITFPDATGTVALTSDIPSESDTLDTVTSRGNTTTNGVTVGESTISNLTLSSPSAFVNRITSNVALQLQSADNATGAAGTVSLSPGSGTTTTSITSASVVGMLATAATAQGGGVKIEGGRTNTTTTTSGVGGDVLIIGGGNLANSGTQVGGDVVIDGGGQLGAIGTAGKVLIGTNSNGSGTNSSGTSEITIGHAGSIITFNNSIDVDGISVGLGAGGQTSNIAIGSTALDANTTGTANIAIGSGTLTANTTGFYNVAIGVQSQGSITTTNSNVSVGWRSLQSNSGNENTAIGRESIGGGGNGSFNVGVGSLSLKTNTTGSNNVAIGRSALFSNSTGGNNVAIGRSALATSSTSSNNTAIGNEAMTNADGAQENVAVGSIALRSLTTGLANVAVGHQAMYWNTEGPYNIGVGGSSLYNNTLGFSNVGLGHQAGFSNTTGDRNLSVGNQALYNNDGGNDNIALGNSAGRFIADGITANTSSTSSIFIGNSSRPNASGQSNQIVIGHNAIGNGSNTTTIGNVSTTNTYILGNVNARYKSSAEAMFEAGSTSGTVDHDYSFGNVYYRGTVTSDYTVNFTNVPTSNGITYSMVEVVPQGATAYLPTAVQIAGSAQTILWQGGSTPSGTANGVDVVSFTLIRSNNAWTVLGSVTPYS